MISFENMELARSKDERCIYASSEFPVTGCNDGSVLYDTCKFRHRCALWKAMKIWGNKLKNLYYKSEDMDKHLQQLDFSALRIEDGIVWNDVAQQTDEKLNDLDVVCKILGITSKELVIAAMGGRLQLVEEKTERQIQDNDSSTHNLMFRPLVMSSKHKNWYKLFSNKKHKK